MDFGHVKNDVEEENTVRKGGVDATIQGHAPLLGKPRHARTINLIIRLENQRNLFIINSKFLAPFPTQWSTCTTTICKIMLLSVSDTAADVVLVYFE